MYQVVKRDGKVVDFNLSKIAIAITKAFLAVEGPAAAASGRIHQTVSKLTEMVGEIFQRRMPSGGSIHIEDSQDQVELEIEPKNFRQPGERIGQPLDACRRR